VDPFIGDFVNFPNGRFDDQVDGLVQVLAGEGRLLDLGGDCADEILESPSTGRPRREPGYSPFAPASFGDVWRS